MSGRSLNRIIKAANTTEWGITHVSFDTSGKLTRVRCRRRNEKKQMPTNVSGQKAELAFYYDDEHKDFEIEEVVEMLTQDPPDLFFTLLPDGSRGAEVVYSIRTRANGVRKDNLGSLPDIPSE